MQLQQLQHFLAAVTYGNLGRAAELCNITQPAITRSIQRLEEALGVQLLERSVRGVAPTPAGRVLHEYAREFARDTRLMRQRLADVSGQPLGEVRIGVAAHLPHEGLTAALAVVMRRAPERRLSIVIDFNATLFDKLAAGELDVLVTLRPWDLDEREFSFDEMAAMPGALFVAANHPLRDRRPATLKELADYKWVALAQRDQGYLEQRFGAVEIRPPEIAVTTNSTVLMKELLLAEPLIGIAPRHVFAAEAQIGVLATLDSELDPLSARRGIARRRNAGRSPQLDQFIDDFVAAYLAILPPDQKS
jgi:DNA-binding transcriptional LysR family regulator